MALKWYGVKSLYETTVSAPGSIRKARKRPTGERLITERIVLVRAQSPEHAILAAEKEAHQHAQVLHYRNCDGHLVKTKYLEACDSFAIHGAPGHCVEVYSSMRRVPSAKSQASMLDMLLGPVEIDQKEAERRSVYEPWAPD